MRYNVEDILNDEVFEPYIERFRNHYQRHYNDESYKYYDILPAYYHGFVVASTGNNAAATPRWEVVEESARDEWDDDQQPWEAVSDAIQHAWRDVTGQTNN